MTNTTQITMTIQPKRSAHAAFRTTGLLLFLCFIDARVTATFTTKDAISVHRNDGAASRESERSYRQNQTKGSAFTSGKTRSQKRTINSLHHSQSNHIPTALSAFLRGGSTMRRRKNARSTYQRNDKDEKTIDASNNDNSTTPSSSPSSSSALASSPSSSWSRRDLAVFMASNFFMVLSMSMVVFSPVSALIAEIGSDRATSTLSAIAAGAALTEIVISPALGSLLDSIGRKPALIFALSSIALVHGFVTLHSSVLTICAAKFVGMLCFGSFFTTNQVIISDVLVSNPERMGSTLGIIYALTSCAFLVGAITAGKLSEFGLPATYGTSTVLAALTASLVYFGMHETLQSSKRIPFKENKTHLKKQLLQSPLSSCSRILFRHSKEVRILAIVIMMQSLPKHMNETFQILVRTEWNIDVKDFSSFLGVIGVINIFANIVGSQMVVKLGIKYFTAIATLSSVLAPIGASLFSFRGLVLGCVFGFLASSQMLGVTAALYVEGAKSNVPQGELAGERSSFLALAKVIGPILYSFLYVKGKEVFGTGFLPFWFNAGLGLAAFGISQRYLPY